MPTVKSYLRWLRAPVAILGIAILLLLPLALVLAEVPHAAEPENHWLTWCGVAFQLLGFWIVWRQIRGALQEYGRPTFRQRIKNCWGARPRRDQVVAATGAVLGAATVSATMRTRTRPVNRTAEARLDALESNLESLQEEFDNARNSMSRALGDAKQDLTSLRAAHDETRAELTRVIAEQAVGGSDQEIIGLAFFIVGSIYSAIPTDLVRWLS